jgi:hypothetical protein
MIRFTVRLKIRIKIIHQTLVFEKDTFRVELHEVAINEMRFLRKTHSSYTACMVVLVVS